jgi:hypothetical protein
MTPGTVVDSQNTYRGMSCTALCREVLTAGGFSIRNKTDAEIVTLALHTTSDFPNILAATLNKVLLAAYDYQAPSYKRWAKASTARDFKTMSRNRFGEFPILLALGESGEIKAGTISESKESYAIATYARKFNVTRQVLINDDLNAMQSIPTGIGVQAAALENRTVYAILTANAAMSDSVTLFHATHGNSGTGAISIASFDAMRAAMMIQKGVDGVTLINIQPKYVIVPAAKLTIAQQFLMSSGQTANGVKPNDQAKFNPFAGLMEPVGEGILDATSTTAWYGAGDPNACPTIEYSYLEGQSGPQIIRTENEGDVLGASFKTFLDFGAKAIDWRALYYSTGS